MSLPERLLADLFAFSDRAPRVFDIDGHAPEDEDGYALTTDALGWGYAVGDVIHVGGVPYRLTHLDSRIRTASLVTGGGCEYMCAELERVSA